MSFIYVKEQLKNKLLLLLLNESLSIQTDSVQSKWKFSI